MMNTPKERIERRVQVILDALNQMSNVPYKLDDKQAALIETTIQIKLHDTLNKLQQRPEEYFTLSEDE